MHENQILVSEWPPRKLEIAGKITRTHLQRCQWRVDRQSLKQLRKLQGRHCEDSYRTVEGSFREANVVQWQQFLEFSGKTMNLKIF